MDMQSDDLEEPLVEEVLVLEEDEPADAFSSADEAPASPSDSPSESPRTRRGPELYYEDQIATMELRFAVGERVECSVDKGNAEGVVVKRFYREEEWPKGYYAAYQVRLDHALESDATLIYAPRDLDRYIRRAAAPTTPESMTIHVDRKMSQQRRLLRELEASLRTQWTSLTDADEKKQMLYDQLRNRHKEAMRRVIATL